MISPTYPPSSVERSPLDVGVLRTGILAFIALIVGSMFVYDLALSSPGTAITEAAAERSWNHSGSCSPSDRKIAFEPFTGDTQNRRVARVSVWIARKSLNLVGQPPSGATTAALEHVPLGLPQRPQNPPPYCVAEPNHPPPPNPPPPKKPHWGTTCLTCAGMRSLA